MFHKLKSVVVFLKKLFKKLNSLTKARATTVKDIISKGNLSLNFHC